MSTMALREVWGYKKNNNWQGLTLSIAQVHFEVGQVIPGTYLPDGQVKFAEKYPSKYLFIKEVIGRAGLIDIRAGKFRDLPAHGQVN